MRCNGERRLRRWTLLAHRAGHRSGEESFGDRNQAGGAANEQDAEYAEPRLPARPRRTRHNRMMCGATAGFAPADASLLMGTAHGTPPSGTAVPLNVEPSTCREPADARRIIRLCRVPFPRRAPAG